MRACSISLTDLGGSGFSIITNKIAFSLSSKLISSKLPITEPIKILSEEKKSKEEEEEGVVNNFTFIQCEDTLLRLDFILYVEIGFDKTYPLRLYHNTNNLSSEHRMSRFTKADIQKWILFFSSVPYFYRVDRKTETKTETRTPRL